MGRLRSHRAVTVALVAGCLAATAGVATAGSPRTAPPGSPPGSSEPPATSTAESSAPPAETGVSSVPESSAPTPTDAPVDTLGAATDVPASSEPAAPSVPEAADRGVVAITGSVAYSDPFFVEGVAEPIVVLEDQSGFIARDRSYVFPVDSQVLGELTSDFYTSPFTYSLNLPIAPDVTLHDVDNDDVAEAGVGVYAVAYWTNTWGDPYLEERDQGGGGWSTAYASTVVSTDPDAYYEVVGGKLVIYAPDDQQAFPTDFGPDGKLFTADDPAAPIPAGWSIVDLDQSPFAIERSAQATVDLLEPEALELVDFSDLSYTEAFDAMVEKFRNEYAFTEFKGIDWDAKSAEFRPLFEAAEAAGDPHAYALAVRDFLWSIPDTHVGYGTELLDEDFAVATAGGLGLGLGETDDGKVVVTFVLEGGPAAAAGIELGAVVTSLGGQPVADVIDATVPWSSPFSNPEFERLQQLRYATRFPLDAGPIEVTYTNPGGASASASLEVVEESDSFAAASIYASESPTALPVEFSLLPSGLGYIKVSSFFDNQLLTIQLWERAIDFMIANEIPGIVLDMRVNDGGFGWLADQMAAYFFHERTVTGQTELYNEATDAFFLDPDGEQLMIPPPEHLRYDGAVVVTVGVGCASACEFFSYDMTIDDRATIVGQYATAGAGGSVSQFLMPEDVMVQLTEGRATDPDGNIHIEGGGVVPDVDVPVTVESLLRTANGDDVVLEAAEQELISQLGG